MLTAVLIGNQEQLKRAYPEAARAELSGRVHLLPAEIPGRSWRDHWEALAQADLAFATWGMPKMDGEFLSAAGRLKAVFYAAGTVKSFATEESFARGVKVMSAWEANAIPVAEYAMSTILLSLKRFWQYARETSGTRRWSHHLAVPGAYGAVVGLVSLGAVGRSVAARLGQFDVKLVAYDPHVRAEVAARHSVRLVSLEDLFRRADVVSLHAPLLPETAGLVDGKLLRLMKPGATLINTARGGIVNEAGLCEVLRERPDLIAILDVTSPEPPLPDSPLFALENVILTPHIAGSMGGEVTRLGRSMIDEFYRYLDGEPLRYAVSAQMLSTAA